jgi:hypothetical protein|tara:strand:- start:133 stop:516 length:384 start_codon:yes stop_codon:yes gene_type:complete
MKKYIFITLLVMSMFSQTSSAADLHYGTPQQKVCECFAFFTQAYAYGSKRGAPSPGLAAAAKVYLTAMDKINKSGLMSITETNNVTKKYLAYYKTKIDYLVLNDLTSGRITECLNLEKDRVVGKYLR